MHNNGDRRSAAIGNIAMLCLLSGLVFPVVNVVFFIMVCVKDRNRPTRIVNGQKIDDSPKCLGIFRRIIITVTQTVGAMLYLYGDNIGYIFQNYSEELGCGEQCLINNRIAAVLTLGLALMILHLFPAALKQVDHIIIEKGDTDWNDKTSAWYNGLDMIATIVKIDIVYTTIAILTQTEEFCGHTDRALSIAFIIFIMIIGLVVIIINGLYAWVVIDDDDSVILLVVSAILLVPCMVLYLLADNAQPLDCEFGCDTFAANQTMNDISCDVLTNSGVRLGLMILTFIVVGVFALLWIIIGLCSDNAIEQTDWHEEELVEMSDVDTKSKPVVT